MKMSEISKTIVFIGILLTYHSTPTESGSILNPGLEGKKILKIDIISSIVIPSFVFENVLSKSVKI